MERAWMPKLQANSLNYVRGASSFGPCLLSQNQNKALVFQSKTLSQRLKNWETLGSSGTGACLRSEERKSWKALSMPRNDELEALLQAQYDWDGAWPQEKAA
jgi:hypothetical protein